MVAFAAEFEVIDVPSRTKLYGTDGLKRLLLFFVESFPDMRAERINAFATEDQVTLQGIWRWNDTGHLYLPSGALPSRRRSGGLRSYFVLEMQDGKIARLQSYYDMMTLMEQLGPVP